MNVAASAGDRMRGVLVGTVIGDAFGNPLEGAPASTLYDQLRRRARQPAAWRYTDDGAMTIALAESLAETGTITPSHLLARMRARYEPARGFGRGMKLAFAALDRGEPLSAVPYAAWPEGSRGNGGAVRVGVVALRPWTDPISLRSAAVAATRLTHAHDDAVSAALIQVALVAPILLEPALADAVPELLDRATPFLTGSPSALHLLDRIRDAVLHKPSPVEISRSFGSSMLAVESVPAAIASFLCTHSTFEDAILQAAAIGGDVDSICAIVGALAGAVHGVSGIPPLWLDALATEMPPLNALCALVDKVTSLEPAAFRDEAG
jgi:poly(ADP-ribose) glycohydrolase ARH3